jgi:hypothetical protein
MGFLLTNITTVAMNKADRPAATLVEIYPAAAEVVGSIGLPYE